jgi:hypothetical protein
MKITSTLGVLCRIYKWWVLEMYKGHMNVLETLRVYILHTIHQTVYLGTGSCTPSFSAVGEEQVRVEVCCRYNWGH